MSDVPDEVALRAWSLGRATREQRARVVGALLAGEDSARAATATAVLPAGPAADPPPGYGRLFDRALSRARATATAIVSEQDRAEELVASLRALDSLGRRARLGALSDEERSPSLVEQLAAEGYARRFGAVQEALEWTRLGVEVASQVGLAFPSRLVADARGSAWAFHGNALRVAGHYEEAEAAFARARREENDGTGDVRRRAERLRFEAGLAVDRSRFAVGERLYRRSQTLCEEVGDQQGAARVLLAHGSLALSTGRPADALPLLVQAEERLQALGDARRALVARHDRLVALIDLGQYREALPLFAELRNSYDPVDDQHELIRLAWLEARALAGGGHAAAAEARFVEARQAFLDQGLLMDAAFLTLDLSALLIRQQRWPELAASAAGMAKVFDAAGSYREAVAALELLSLAAKRGQADAVLLAQLGRTFEKLS